MLILDIVKSSQTTRLKNELIELRKKSGQDLLTDENNQEITSSIDSCKKFLFFFSNLHNKNFLF